MAAVWARSRIRTFLVLVALALPSQAQALTLTYTVEDTLGPVGSGSATSPSTSLLDTNGAFTLFMNSPGSGDPLQLNFNASNTSPRPQTYVLTVSLPIAPTSFSAGSLAAASGLTLSDGNSPPDGALLSSSGGAPVFQATIGGTPVADLFPSPYSLSCSSSGLLSCNAVDSTSITVPTLPALPEATSRGITYRFELAAGDSVAGTGTAAALAVPEPSQGMLFLIGGGFLTLRRRARTPTG